MASEALIQAFDLMKTEPLPADIVEQVQALEALADPGEDLEFSMIYEGINLVLDDTSGSAAQIGQ